MKTFTTYYSDKCKAFRSALYGMPGVTTFENETVEGFTGHGFEHITNQDGEQFDGTAYINHYEFVCVGDWGDGKFTVYINNPSGHDDEQWIFGRYASFKRAINRAVAIVKARKYPKPVEVW